MAAAEAGTATAELPPLPPLLPPPFPALGGAGTERALEEAAASGTLILAGRRLRSFPAAAARRWDLSDTTQADLSRNRFGEVPEAACHLVSLEGLSLRHNCLRSLPPAIGNLRALAHLDLSRNHLTSLPPCLCLLPLRVLNAGNNRLAQLPENIGALGALRQLDVSCNELRALPPGVGRLKSLRDLNLRRNQLTALPPELSDLPLVRLDFSCNRVVAIPRCFRRLRHLQILSTDNNPLQSPPAQICLKGKVHIFKYLHLNPEPTATPRPPPTCPTDELCPLRRRGGGLDSGFNSVDSGSKRWSGNESTDEFLEPPRQLKEKRSGAAGDSDPEQVDFIGEEEEEETPLERDSSPGGDAPEKGGGGSPPEPGAAPQRPPRPAGPDETPGPPPAPPKPNSFLFRRCSTKTTAPPPRDPPLDADERELMAEMRESIEALLQLRLPEELGGALTRLRPHLAPFLHVPAPPKLCPPPPTACRIPETFNARRPPQVQPPPPQSPPPGVLAGFALFYALVMALLFTAYRALFGC